jgi:hypothetical protein
MNLHAARVLWHEERGTQPEKSLLDAFVSHVVGVLRMAA